MILGFSEFMSESRHFRQNLKAAPVKRQKTREQQNGEREREREKDRGSCALLQHEETGIHQITIIPLDFSEVAPRVAAVSRRTETCSESL